MANVEDDLHLHNLRPYSYGGMIEVPFQSGAGSNGTSSSNIHASDDKIKDALTFLLSTIENSKED